MCNGTRLLITHLEDWIIETKIIGSNVGSNVLIPRIIFISNDSKWPFPLRKRRFPVNICYAMTINKIQGKSSNYMELYLPRSIFGHGQLYMVFLGVPSPKGFQNFHY